MGFTITSPYEVNGITKTNNYCTIKRKVTSDARVSPEGKNEYFVRFTPYIFPDYLRYLEVRHRPNWINNATEQELILTFEQFSGNVRQAVYNDWKAQLSGHTFVDDIEPSNPVMDLHSGNDLEVPNSNCKYYVILGNTQIATIKSTDFKTNDVLTLQFTQSITVKHATVGTYAQIFLTGNVDFSATPKCTLTLTFDGTVWNETARSVPS